MKTIKKHAWAICLAIAVGAIAGAPYMLMPAALGSGYHGIQLNGLDDEDVYRARIHEVLDGHFAVASPFLYEYKNTSPLAVAPINDWLFAIPAYLFGLSFVIVVSKFLLPALLFFLAYLFVRRVLEDDDSPLVVIVALVAGALATYGVDLVNYQAIIAALKGLSPPNFLVWTRLENPAIGGIETFLFLYLMLRVYREGRTFVAPAALVLALTVGYFFSFGITNAILGSLFLAALLRKEFVAARQLATVFAIALVLDAWYWYSTLTAVGGTAGRALALRYGMFFTHAPVLNKLLLVATILTALLYCCTRYIQKNHSYGRTWAVVASLLAGSWIAFNQQVLTGREIWIPHFVQYVIPISLVAVTVSVYLVLRNKTPRVLRIGGILILIGCAAYGLWTLTAIHWRVNDFATSQTSGELVDWLNSNAPKDCVVLVDPHLPEAIERTIPGYTACDTYSTTITFSGVPMLRVYHNYFLRLRLLGVTAATINAYLTANPMEVREYFFNDWNELFATHDDAWLDAMDAKIEKYYVPYLRTNLSTDIRIYRADYYLSATPLSPDLSTQLPSLHLVATFPDYYLYSF